MAKDLECPTCEGPIILDGKVKPGEELFCPTCGAPSVLKPNEDDEELHPEEDY